MAATSFGRRGAAGAQAAPARRTETAPAVSSPGDSEEVNPAMLPGETDLVSLLPILTTVIIVFLALVFALERRFALDMGKHSQMSLESLIAFGAAGYDLVFRSKEWWRIFLAPTLHADLHHLLGNCFALAFVGWRLEPKIGRRWFAAIFVLSGLGGVAGSLIGNPHELVTVGASGAISGLIGALFAMSFNLRAEPHEQALMRRTALRFGVPALLPLAFGASGGTDYFAHFGGALTGAAAGLFLALEWSDARVTAKSARWAGRIALAGLAASFASSAFAAANYKPHIAIAAQWIPVSATPSDMDEGAKRSAGFVAKYPKDPRSHLFRAHAYVKEDRSRAAEGELRSAISLATGFSDRGVRMAAQGYLAAMLADQGRQREAKALAKDLCQSKEAASMRKILVKAKLCA